MSGNGPDLGAIYQAIIALDRKLDRGLTELHADVAALRGEVAAYHGSVVGHGVLISELDERVTRLEQRQEPPPEAA